MSEPKGAAEPAVAHHHGVASRLMRNIGWLLGGRGFVGVTSIVYLGLAARALGPAGFGIFSVILTYGQLVTNIIQFQSWKAVIRFGAVHSASQEWARLARVLGFTATLDWASGLLGTLAAGVLAILLAPVFHWSGPQTAQAALFTAAMLLTSVGTPTGMLRLFDRFDLLTFSEALAPLCRLIGAVVAWYSGGGVGAFLLVWALASLAQMIGTWASAILIHGSRVSLGRRSFTASIGENPGLWRFMVQTSLSSSLGFFGLQAGTLALGAFAGPTTAGGFRLADRLTTGITKSTDTVTRALYPELARLAAIDDRPNLRKVFRRISIISIGLAVLTVLICAVGGKLILRLVAGPQFAFAEQFLVLLAISTAIELSGFALEPLHNAHGWSGRVLRARVIGTLFYVVLLAVLLPTIGAIGAAFAAIGTSAVVVFLLARSSRAILGGP